MMKKHFIYFTAFLLPIILYTFSYFSIGVFLENSILINDLFSQYSSFLSYYRNDIINNGIFYSFSKGMGGNFFGVFTYYLMSPFNLIVFLFKSENIDVAIGIIMILKSGITGLTASIFLSNQDNQHDFSTVAFSVFYAMSSCFVVWHYHILWSDIFYLLPLIILGTQYILNAKSKKLYIISLTAALIINFYMAYMVCLFVILYFIYSIIINYDKINILKYFLDMAKSTIISVLLSLFVLVPTIYSLLQGKVSYADNLGLTVRTFIINIFALAPKFLNSGYDSVGTVSSPFIYCGISVFILILAFFCLKNISLKEKLATGFIFFALSISLTFKPLYLMFHMFSAPNGFPYRFVFLLTFFSVVIAYKAYRNSTEVNYKYFFILISLSSFIIGLLVYIYPVLITKTDIVLTIIFALSTVLVIILSKKNNLLSALILIIAVFDMGINTQNLLNKNYQALGIIPSDYFSTTYTQNEIALSTLPSDGFYRIYSNNPNDSFKNGFNNFYESFTSFPENNSEYIKHTYLQSNSHTQIARAIFGVKYNLINGLISEEMEAFPLIFTADSDIFKKDNSSLENFIFNLYGIEYIEDTEINAVQFDEIISVANDNTSNVTVDKNKITAHVFADNTNTYALTSIPYDSGWSVHVNGKKVETEKILESLLAFPIDKGDNTVILTYYPVGYRISALISIITFLFFLLYEFIRKAS